MSTHPFRQAEPLEPIRQIMEPCERSYGKQETYSQGSDDISPMSRVTPLKKKKKKDKDSKSKDPEKAKRKKEKKRAEQSSQAERSEDSWEHQKGPSLLDDDEQADAWGSIRRSDSNDHQTSQPTLEHFKEFSADFAAIDFDSEFKHMKPLNRLQSWSPTQTAFDDFCAANVSSVKGRGSDTGRDQLDRVMYSKNSKSIRSLGRQNRSDPDDQSFAGWVVDNTNKGENIRTYNSRRTSLEFDGTVISSDKVPDFSQTNGGQNFFDDQKSEHNESRTTPRSHNGGSYVGEHKSQNGDERSRESAVRKGSFGVYTEDVYQTSQKQTRMTHEGNVSFGGDSRGGSHGRETWNADKVLRVPQVYDDAYYGGVAPDREGAIIGEDDFNDSASIRSDLTGLTGAFFNNAEAEVLDDDENDEPDVAPLAYPMYDKKAHLDFHMVQKVERRKCQEQRGPFAVRFSRIEVREYERILGDNPSCTAGASISIGWRYKEGKPSSVDEVEDKKAYKKSAEELLLNREARELMLLELGYSQKEIASATRCNLRDKNKRRQTVQNLGASSLEESLESASRNVKRMLGFGRRRGVMST